MASRPAPAKKAPAKKAAAKPPATAARKSKSAAPAPKAKAVAAPVVTLKTVFEQLGVSHDLPKKQVQGLLADFVAAVTMHLKQGARIRMSGLGTLEVKARDGLVVTSVPKVPIWKPRNFNVLRPTWHDNILI